MTTHFLRVPVRAMPAESGCVIDCDTCTVRGDACDDCVVSVMLGGPPEVVPADAQRALDVLAGAGFVPPLKMTPPVPGDGQGDGPGPPEAPGPPSGVPTGVTRSARPR